MATYTTDKNGEIHITNSDSKPKYQYEAVYYVVETKDPAGYEDPKNPIKYYFTYSKVNTNLDFVPIELKGKVKDLSNDPGLDLVPNNKIKQTNLTVKKEWLRADSSKTECFDGSIAYDLIQVATDSQDNSTETVYKSGETLTHDDDWTRTYKGLPVSGKNAAGNEVDYKYYVRETPVSGYDTSYSNGETTPDNPKPSIIDSSEKRLANYCGRKLSVSLSR